MAIEERTVILVSFSCFFLFAITCYSQGDTLQRGEPLTDGNHLISANGHFKLGFLSLGASQNRYLGIFLHEYAVGYLWEETVWEANPNDPVPDSSGNLIIDDEGELKITYNGESIRVSNHNQIARNASAVLQNDGNLILKEHLSDGAVRILWQRFDHPRETLLPGMKLGVDLRTRYKWTLTSWRSPQVPATGSFTLGADFSNTNQLILRRQGEVIWASGPWHNASSSFDNLPLSTTPPHQDGRCGFRYVSNKNERYFTFCPEANYNPHGQIPRLVLSPAGQLFGTNGLSVDCDQQAFGRPGCVKRLSFCRSPTSHSFSARDFGYAKFDGFRFDDHNMTIMDCEVKCWNDCSCVSFASIGNETGCEIWSKENRPREYSKVRPRKIYFLQTNKARVGMIWWRWLIATSGGALIVLLLCCLSYLGWKKYKLQEQNKRQEELLFELGAITKPLSNYDKFGKRGEKTNELQLFSFKSLAIATNDFTMENKLGEGGFGPVFKGKLLDEQEVAIKRLSRSSGQGFEEFKNEIALIAKLQHNNLVKLLGCCIQGEEKILIYEYLPNKSLDFFLFDSSRKNLLDWKKRYTIIEGITQGLLYLHKFSRLRVIHRDLKASNILLDNEMNPKISDFGMARIFGGNESEANTKRVVGTYGYMSPEYAMQGIFSAKSDVFSFGVLLLEILSGRKNHSNYHYEHPVNLTGYAWELWKEGKALELVDEALDGSCPNNIIIRCIHVALLCVQENPIDRPTMTDIVGIFGNESMQLPTPKQPAFFIGRTMPQTRILSPKLECCSINDVSISVMEAR